MDTHERRRLIQLAERLVGVVERLLPQEPEPFYSEFMPSDDCRDERPALRIWNGPEATVE